MSSFHFQIITLKNSHSGIFTLYVTVLTSFQENDPYTFVVFTCIYTKGISLSELQIIFSQALDALVYLAHRHQQLAKMKRFDINWM